MVAPQVVITLIFFIWPASQAAYQSFLLEDAFGMSTEFVWFENFIYLATDEIYLDSFGRTIFFSFWRPRSLIWPHLAAGQASAPKTGPCLPEPQNGICGPSAMGF